MKKPPVLCIVLCVGASTTAAFARGGMGGHGMGSHMSMRGVLRPLRFCFFTTTLYAAMGRLKPSWRAASAI
jgi:hypothetical protein